MNPEVAISKQVQKSSPWQLRIGERRAVLLVGDLLMALISWGLALYFWASSEKFLGISAEFLQKRVNPQPWFYLMPLIWLVLLVELYDVHRAGDWGRTIRGVALAALVGLVLYVLLYFYYVDPPRSLLPRRGVAGFLVAVSL